MAAEALSRAAGSGSHDRRDQHDCRLAGRTWAIGEAFTLELEGRAPLVVSKGQAFVEPPNVGMTGYNRSTTEALHLVIFYVSDPDTPFLDPLN